MFMKSTKLCANNERVRESVPNDKTADDGFLKPEIRRTSKNLPARARPPWGVGAGRTFGYK